MRLWKKALSLVLVSAMAFSMCACGGKKDEGSKKLTLLRLAASDLQQVTQLSTEKPCRMVFSLQ